MNIKNVPINLLFVAAAINKKMPPMSNFENMGRIIASECEGMQQEQIDTVKRLVERMRGKGTAS